MVLCPECEYLIDLTEDVQRGDLILCDRCGAELRVAGTHPLKLQLADDTESEAVESLNVGWSTGEAKPSESGVLADADLRRTDRREVHLHSGAPTEVDQTKKQRVSPRRNVFDSSLGKIEIGTATVEHGTRKIPLKLSVSKAACRYCGKDMSAGLLPKYLRTALSPKKALRYAHTLLESEAGIYTGEQRFLPPELHAQEPQACPHCGRVQERFACLLLNRKAARQLALLLVDSVAGAMEARDDEQREQMRSRSTISSMMGCIWLLAGVALTALVLSSIGVFAMGRQTPPYRDPPPRSPSLCCRRYRRSRRDWLAPVPE